MKNKPQIAVNVMTYSPTFRITENATTDFSDAKVGGKIKALINYEVVEVTKSYIVLRVNFFSVVKSRRIV